MSIDIETFLNKTVPDVLRVVEPKHLFIVVGTRSVNAYLNIAQKPTIYTQDWDVLYVGDNAKAFAQNVANIMNTEGYKIKIEYHDPSGQNNDVFSFRSRPWIRLAINLSEGNTNITFLDIYTISELNSGAGTFMEKDGLIYSDLGFLVRELSRSEQDAVKVINNSSTISDKQIQEKLTTSQKLLNDIGVDIDQLDEDTDELIESVGQLPDNTILDISDKQRRELEHAKHTLIRVFKERDALFGAMAGGKIPKFMIGQVCDICRHFENFYGKYNQLKERCYLIRQLCD